MFSGHIVTPMALDGYMLILHHNSTAGARIDSSREINQEVFSIQYIKNSAITHFIFLFSKVLVHIINTEPNAVVSLVFIDLSFCVMRKHALHAHAYSCMWGQKGGEQGATPSYNRNLIGSCCCPDTV